MKNFLKLFLLLFAFAVTFTACDKDDDDNTPSEWQLANEAAFAKIAANSEYTKLESQSKNGYIMYKVLNAGTGAKSPIYTDKVKVKYTGWLKYDWTKDDSYVDSNGNYVTNKITFDSSLITPATFNVGGVVDGFATALQQMVVGDKWEIWIPWKLGYGSSSSSSTIPNYTTLVFEIELTEIVE